MKFLAGILIALGLGSAALAGPIPSYPPATQPLTGNEQLICAQYGVSKICTPSEIVGSTGSITVANNTALTALPHTAAPSVVRLGNTLAGDAPVITYLPSASPCSVNDGGTCVPSSDSGSWHAILPGGGMALSDWTGTPASSDWTTVTQAAATALTGKFTALLIDGQYNLSSPGLTVPGGVPLAGTSFMASNNQTTNSKLLCAAGAYVCLTMGNTSSSPPIASNLSDLSIQGDFNTPVAGSVGVELFEGYSDLTQNVNVAGFDTCMEIVGINGNADAFEFYNPHLGACATSYLKIDRVPEVYIVGGRFGEDDIGTGVAGTDVITFTNSIAQAVFPNTFNMIGTHINPLGATSITCGLWCFRNFAGGFLENTDVSHLTATSIYEEFHTWNANPGWLVSDNTLGILAYVTIASSGLTWPSTVHTVTILNLSRYTRLFGLKLVDNIFSGGGTSDVNLLVDTQDVNGDVITGNTFPGGVSYVSEYGTGHISGVVDNGGGLSTMTVDSAVTFVGPRLGAVLAGVGVSGARIVADSTACNFTGCVVATACGGIACTGTAGSALGSAGTTGTYALSGDLTAAAETVTFNPTNSLKSENNLVSGNLVIAGHWQPAGGCLKVDDEIDGTITDTATGCVKMAEAPQTFTPSLVCGAGSTPCGTYAASGQQGWTERDSNGGYTVSFNITLASLTGSGIVSVQGIPSNLVCASQAQWNAGSAPSANYTNANANLKSSINLLPLLAGTITLAQANANSGTQSMSNTALTDANLTSSFSVAGSVHCAQAA